MKIEKLVREIRNSSFEKERPYEDAIDKVQYCIFKKEYGKALSIMEAIIEKYEEFDPREKNPSVVDRSCNEQFEDILYLHLYNPEDDGVAIEQGYSMMYLLYGSILFDLKRHKDAIAALQKAIRWNPVSALILCECAENYKMLKDLETFAEITRKAFELAFRPDELARCYRNMAYYCVEKGMYQEAICCNLFSLEFEASEIVQSELFYIMSEAGTEFAEPEYEDFQAAFEKLDIPFGPNKEILELAYTCGTELYEDGKYEMAEYFLEIFDDFVDDEDVKEMLADIRGEDFDWIGTVKDAISDFVMDPNDESYTDVIMRLALNTVWVPVSEVTTAKGSQIMADILHKDDERFFPVFTSPGEMGEYGDAFFREERLMKEVVEMAESHETEVDGIVVNAFTEPFEISREMFNFFIEFEEMMLEDCDDEDMIS